MLQHERAELGQGERGDFVDLDTSGYVQSNLIFPLQLPIDPLAE